MKQAEFEQALKDKGRGPKLEDWIATSDELIAANNGDANVVPDGGPWKGGDGQDMPIGPGFLPGSRVKVRNYCMWIEMTLPDGETGIQVSAHGPNADRFL